MRYEIESPTETEVQNLLQCTIRLLLSFDEAYHRIFDQKEKANEVYLKVGFKDIAHFYHSFKEFYGFTPSVK